MRISIRVDNNLQVFKLGITSNKKIAAQGEKIVQTYTYSKLQFEYVKQHVANGTSPSLKEFYSLDSENCFDCPFSGNSGNGKCYTHKFGQYRGFIGMIKSIVREFGSFESIPTFDSEKVDQITTMCENRFVRFGSYGEPAMHDIKLVSNMASVSKSWSGYTHQYFKNIDFSKFFMASVHNELQAITASKKFGYRSFIASDNNGSNATKCPASKESGFKSNCSACGLCSGVNGKGKKDVHINEH